MHMYMYMYVHVHVHVAMYGTPACLAALLAGCRPAALPLRACVRGQTDPTRQGGGRWCTNQASMYFILCVRYTQDTSQYITIHEAQCISIANHKIREYVSEYVRIL